MRYADLTSLPGTTEEAKNSILDLVAIYASKNKTEIPMKVVLAILHDQGYDMTPKMIIDIVTGNSSVKDTTTDMITLKGADDAGLDVEGAEDQVNKDKEKNQKHVEKLAQKAARKRQ
jgi:hypothetical protein